MSVEGFQSLDDALFEEPIKTGDFLETISSTGGSSE